MRSARSRSPAVLALASTTPAVALHRTDCDDGYRAYAQRPSATPPSVSIQLGDTLEAGSEVLLSGVGQAATGRKIVNYCRFLGDPNRPSEQHYDFLRSSSGSMPTSTQSHTYTVPGFHTAWIHAIDDRDAWSPRVTTTLASGPFPPPPPPPSPPAAAVAPPPPAAPRPLTSRVRVRARATRRAIRLTLLSVATESGARVQVRCGGRGCPRGARTKRAGGRLVRFRHLRRALRTGAWSRCS